MGRVEIETIYRGNRNIFFQKWILDGNLHNEDGPAYIQYFNNGNVEYQVWCINDILHNDNGPAKIHYNESGDIKYQSWWINGKQYSEEEFLALKNDLEVFV